jgi:hypothetical protein
MKRMDNNDGSVKQSNNSLNINLQVDFIGHSDSQTCYPIIKRVNISNDNCSTVYKEWKLSSTTATNCRVALNNNKVFLRISNVNDLDECRPFTSKQRMNYYTSQSEDSNSSSSSSSSSSQSNFNPLQISQTIFLNREQVSTLKNHWFKIMQEFSDASNSSDSVQYFYLKDSVNCRQSKLYPYIPDDSPTVRVAYGFFYIDVHKNIACRENQLDQFCQTVGTVHLSYQEVMKLNKFINSIEEHMLIVSSSIDSLTKIILKTLGRTLKRMLYHIHGDFTGEDIDMRRGNIFNNFLNVRTEFLNFGYLNSLSTLIVEKYNHLNRECIDITTLISQLINSDLVFSSEFISSSEA